MDLHHVAIGARDVDRVAGFYRDLVGLPELARHREDDGTLRSVWLALGGAILMVERTVEEPRNVHGVAAGPFLLAFAVDRGGRDALELRLSRAGRAVESRTEHTIYFRDPEGNRVAASSRPCRGTPPVVRT